MLIEISIEELERVKKLGITFTEVKEGIGAAIDRKYDSLLGELLEEVADEYEPAVLEKARNQACEEQSRIISKFFGDDFNMADRLGGIVSEIVQILTDAEGDKYDEEEDEG